MLEGDDCAVAGRANANGPLMKGAFATDHRLSSNSSKLPYSSNNSTNRALMKEQAKQQPSSQAPRPAAQYSPSSPGYSSLSQSPTASHLQGSPLSQGSPISSPGYSSFSESPTHLQRSPLSRVSNPGNPLIESRQFTQIPTSEMRWNEHPHLFTSDNTSSLPRLEGPQDEPRFETLSQSSRQQKMASQVSLAYGNPHNPRAAQSQQQSPQRTQMNRPKSAMFARQQHKSPMNPSRSMTGLRSGPKQIRTPERTPTVSSHLQHKADALNESVQAHQAYKNQQYQMEREKRLATQPVLSQGADRQGSLGHSPTKRHFQVIG